MGLVQHFLGDYLPVRILIDLTFPNVTHGSKRTGGEYVHLSNLLVVRFDAIQCICCRCTGFGSTPRYLCCQTPWPRRHCRGHNRRSGHTTVLICVSVGRLNSLDRKKTEQRDKYWNHIISIHSASYFHFILFTLTTNYDLFILLPFVLVFILSLSCRVHFASGLLRRRRRRRIWFLRFHAFFISTFGFYFSHFPFFSFIRAAAAWRMCISATARIHIHIMRHGAIIVYRSQNGFDVDSCWTFLSWFLCCVCVPYVRSVSFI